LGACVKKTQPKISQKNHPFFEQGELAAFPQPPGTLHTLHCLTEDMKLFWDLATPNLLSLI
jgi:hypothetical protein